MAPIVKIGPEKRISIVHLWTILAISHAQVRAGGPKGRKYRPEHAPRAQNGGPKTPLA
jgi:hypothetical protein